MPAKQKVRRKGTESQLLVETAFDLASRLGITKLLVQADEFRDVRLVEKLRGSERIIWITRGEEELAMEKGSQDLVIHIPDPALSRMSQMKLGLFLAALNDYVDLDESVLLLSGVAGSQRLDMLVIANPRGDFPWFRKGEAEDGRDAIATREFARTIDIALRLAAEGREGRPIGTIFVLGDIEELSPYLRQLVLNPCEGHPRKERNIHNEDFLETLREFAALDGAFTISKRGVVETAATYLDAPVSKAKLHAGHGARHVAALAITAVTQAIAVVISSSSGTVTVFHEGKAILELEKPHIQPPSKSSRG